QARHDLPHACDMRGGQGRRQAGGMVGRRSMKLTDADGESILQEAQRLTHGNRNASYGHPLVDYSRTAALVSAMLAHKLKEPLTASEMACAMICVKLSRQMNAPKRDNMVDLAGYAWVAQECLDKQAELDAAASRRPAAAHS